MIITISAPYTDRNPSNHPEDRRFAISLMTLFLMFWTVLVIIGVFFRGPGYSLVTPYLPFFDNFTNGLHFAL